MAYEFAETHLCSSERLVCDDLLKLEAFVLSALVAGLATTACCQHGCGHESESAAIVSRHAFILQGADNARSAFSMPATMRPNWLADHAGSELFTRPSAPTCGA
jgi:hypothetical protein